MFVSLVKEEMERVLYLYNMYLSLYLYISIYLLYIYISIYLSISLYYSLIKAAYFVKISDPKYGGTYLTLLNTLSNFAGMWPKLPVMSAVDWLSVRKCENNFALWSTTDFTGWLWDAF